MVPSDWVKFIETLEPPGVRPDGRAMPQPVLPLPVADAEDNEVELVGVAIVVVACTVVDAVVAAEVVAEVSFDDFVVNFEVKVDVEEARLTILAPHTPAFD